jgi:DNA excision repair protein ERCC-1
MSGFRGISPATVGGNGSIVLHVRKSQNGNPLLAHLHKAKVEWKENDELYADYVAKSTGILFLQVSVHRRTPQYIRAQMHRMRNMFKLRVLLLHYNEQETEVGCSAANILEELNALCLVSDFSLVVAMTVQECARYLEYFLEFEGTTAASIKGHYEKEFMPRVTQMLTMARKVSKTDAKTLMNDFTNLKNVVTSSPEELSICQGVGALKAKRMAAVFNISFKQQPTMRKEKTTTMPAPATT